MRSSSLSSLSSASAKGDIPHRFAFLLDVVFRLKYMAALEIARDAGRKYGITLVMLYQSLGHAIRPSGASPHASSWTPSRPTLTA
jgi:type IV secretion system protein VirD4